MIVCPTVTWPSPAMTTRPRWRTERIVVPRMSGTRMRLVVRLHQAAASDVRGAQRGAADGDDALLPSLAEDTDEPRVRVEVLPVEARQLAHAEPRGVEQLDDRAIATAEERVAARGREQLVDVVEGQMRRQLATR